MSACVRRALRARLPLRSPGAGHACRIGNMKDGGRRRFGFTRALLLLEVERRCALGRCAQTRRVALTKAEAHRYVGFTCERCARWNEDRLTERDVPEWWNELRADAVDVSRTTPPPVSVDEAWAREWRDGLRLDGDGSGAIEERLNAAWRRAVHGDAEAGEMTDGDA